MNVRIATSTINSVLTSLEPIPILFSHKCGDVAHLLHEEITPYFTTRSINLQLDPFKLGQDIQVEMRRLQIHGLIFHCTPLSVPSPACQLELETARRLQVPITALQDGVPVPTGLKARLYPRLTDLTGTCRQDAFRLLASQMSNRARVHSVLRWLSDNTRTVEEREQGCAWLHDRSQEILAEFLTQIAALHHGTAEDNIVCRLLAQILGRTKLPEAIPILQNWLGAATHPNARLGLELAIKSI